MSKALAARIAAGLQATVAPEVRAFAEELAHEHGASAVLFYGSNLRSRSLDGVLDFYVLLPGPPERGIWPRVAYRERTQAGQVQGGQVLRAKLAVMTLAKFAQAASGRLLDTTIWARFVQPSALVWARDEVARAAVVAALADAAGSAARLAAGLGPESGTEADYWAALFRATYQAEFRVERAGRERAILEAGGKHFEGLLAVAWAQGGIAFEREGELLRPRLSRAQCRRIARWWQIRRRAGKPLNLIRLLRAPATFDGATRYAAWKIERHTGLAVPVTPWRERHPLLAAPGVLWSLWRHRRRAGQRVRDSAS